MTRRYDPGVRLFALALAASLLTGCPSGTDGGADSDRVQVGQRYRFVMGGLPETEQVYEVLEVDAFSVRYQGRPDEAGQILEEAVDRFTALGTDRGDAMAARGEASLALLARRSVFGFHSEPRTPKSGTS